MSAAKPGVPLSAAQPRVPLNAAQPRVPLLGGRDLDSPVAWLQGRAVSARTLLADATALAGRLPAAGTPLNLCTDRYAFSVTLLAAVMRGQTSLMPPNTLPETLRHTRLPGTHAYAVADATAGDVDSDGLQRIDAPVTPGDGSMPGAASPEVDGERDAVCLLTSGSTGLPQPHRKCWAELQQSIVAQGEAMAALMDWPRIAGLNLVATVPPQHSYGFESSVMLSLIAGCAFDTGRPFYPADIVAALERLPHPRALVTTPFHLKTLLLAGLALPRVELVLCATAPLPPQLAQQAEERFGARVLEIYGCTEAGQVAARRTVAGDVWATTGGMRIHAEPGAGPGTDAGAGTAAEDERFFVTGGPQRAPKPLADRLELIDAQHFRLIGRANDLIHVAGKRSSLSFLNYHLNRVPGVHDGAFWLPDEVPGAVVRPIAFVVAPELGARDVVEALRGPVEAVFLPRQVVFVPELPREANGKLTTGALARFARATLAGGAVPAATAPSSAPPSAPLPIRPSTSPSTPSSTAAPPPPETTLTIPADHPAFDGHFPGAPVLPGAMLVAMVIDAVPPGQLLPPLVVDPVKFLQPVRPGTVLRLCWHAGSARGLPFELFDADGGLVAKGKLAERGPR